MVLQRLRVCVRVIIVIVLMTGPLLGVHGVFVFEVGYVWSMERRTGGAGRCSTVVCVCVCVSSRGKCLACGWRWVMEGGEGVCMDTWCVGGNMCDYSTKPQTTCVLFVMGVGRAENRGNLRKVETEM